MIFSSRAVVLKEWFQVPRDMWQYLETFVVFLSGEGLFGILTGIKPGMLMDILLYTAQPHSKCWGWDTLEKGVGLSWDM